MLILLPVLSFVSLFLLLLESQERSQERPTGGIPAAFLKSAAILAGYKVFFSEILSLFHGLTRAGIITGWSIALGGLIGLGVWRGWIGAGVRRFIRRVGAWEWNGRDVFCGVLLGAILILLLVVAVVSPPNNDDSLQYHMSRVVHWVEQADLRHYAAVYVPALIHPINAELSILHARLLWGNDRLANLVQWTSMLASLIGVIGITGLLGGRKEARWLAVAFAVSVPIGILEATSTQNDYVAAFWYVAFLFFVVLSLQRRLTFFENLCVGLVLGVGMLTKTTFDLFALPILGFFVIRQWIGREKSRAVVELLLIGAVAVFLNAGHWSRNIVTFGSLFGPAEYIQTHATSFGPGAVLGGLVRNLMQNLGTPNSEINARMVHVLKTLFTPLDATMEKFDIEFAWNHENLAGNPVHLLLISLVVLFALMRRRLRAWSPVWTYFVLVCSSYLVLGYFLYDFYGVRYQLPVFIGWAPFFGAMGASILDRTRGWWLAVTVLLLMAALPWVLFNRTRPLLAMRDSTDPLTIPCLAGCTAESVLVAPPTRTMFAGKLALEEPYVQATKVLRESGCRSVGLYLDSHDFEYLFWWLLDAPQSGIHIETLHALPETARYLNPSFQPCAVLCTLCRQGDQIKREFYGLDLVGDYSGRVQLYLSRDDRPGP